MKLNLFIDPNKQTEVPNYINVSNIGNFDTIAEFGECSEIVGLDIIEYIPHNLLRETLSYWVSKLAHGGLLTLSATHLETLIKAYYRKELKNQLFNELLFGKQDLPCNFKKGSVNLEEIRDFLISLKTKVVECRIVGTQFFIKVVRL